MPIVQRTRTRTVAQGSGFMPPVPQQSPVGQAAQGNRPVDANGNRVYAADPDITMRTLDPWGFAWLDNSVVTARQAGVNTNAPNFWNGILKAEADHLRRLTITGPDKKPINLAPPDPPAITSSLINAVINVATAATFPIITNGPGAYIEIYELFLYSAAAQNLQLLDGTSPLMGTLSGFPANGALLWNFTGEPHWILGNGNNFNLVLSAASQVSGYVKFRTVSL